MCRICTSQMWRHGKKTFRRIEILDNFSLNTCFRGLNIHELHHLVSISFHKIQYERPCTYVLHYSRTRCMSPQNTIKIRLNKMAVNTMYIISKGAPWCALFIYTFISISLKKLFLQISKSKLFFPIIIVLMY